jgi:UDP-N-acetylglucosamine--N-acetylmuramyl-(pentapeptide) pyrophosphoryl-undecaprenol N-acetylglucosamine transferase
LRLNEQVPLAFERLTDEAREKLVVLHATGKPWFEQMQALTTDRHSYRLFAYIDAPTAWAAADLAITRSGVSTLSEAAFFGVPVLMIPLPSAAENHQLMNARAVAKAGAGIVIEEHDIASLAPNWQRYVLAEKSRLEAAQAALELSPQGAAKDFARLIDDFLHPERGHSIVSQFVGRAAPEKTTGFSQAELITQPARRPRIMQTVVQELVRGTTLRRYGMESR